jgi:sugar transferase EpsL
MQTNSFYIHTLKRIIDIFFSFLILILFLPIFIFISIVVRLGLGKPVLFRQLRPGRHGKTFQIIKFRTMTRQTGSNGELLSDAERLTAIGRFLRHTSLDELPELINVLKGEMSLVGPRPLLVQYLDRYSPEQARRHEAKPGMTGWAQVNGRNALTWESRFALDVWYVDHISFFLDIKIMLLTVATVFACQGISQPGHMTMEEFKGATHTGNGIFIAPEETETLCPSGRSGVL